VRDTRGKGQFDAAIAAGLTVTPGSVIVGHPLNIDMSADAHRRPAGQRPDSAPRPSATALMLGLRPAIRSRVAIPPHSVDDGDVMDQGREVPASQGPCPRQIVEARPAASQAGFLLPRGPFFPGLPEYRRGRSGQMGTKGLLDRVVASTEISFTSSIRSRNPARADRRDRAPSYRRLWTPASPACHARRPTASQPASVNAGAFRTSHSKPASRGNGQRRMECDRGRRSPPRRVGMSKSPLEYRGAGPRTPVRAPTAARDPLPSGPAKPTKASAAFFP